MSKLKRLFSADPKAIGIQFLITSLVIVLSGPYEYSVPGAKRDWTLQTEKSPGQTH